MNRYLILGASIGVLSWLQLMPTVPPRRLALPGYAFVLILGATLVVASAARVTPHVPWRWHRLAIERLDKLAHQLSAPVRVALGLGLVAALHALYVSNATGTSAAVALACLVMSLSFAGLAMNLRHLASAWRERPLSTD
ncbi:hypothetical protein D9M70_411470 [compost metagenome]